jgi:hypothetical protein
MTAAPRTLLEFNPMGLGRPAERVFPHTLPRRSHAERQRRRNMDDLSSDAAPFKGAGRIAPERMDALREDMIAAGADPSVVGREAYRISDAVREYVSCGPWAPSTDSHIRDDLERAAGLLQALAAFQIGTTAELNINYDFHAEESGVEHLQPAYYDLRALMDRHREDWPILAAHFKAMAESLPVRAGEKPNFLVRLLWTDCMSHWHRATGKWPVTTRDEGGLPLAPLYKHVTAMVWGLTDGSDDEDDALRAAVNGAKPFRYVLDCRRAGRDPFGRP